LENHRKTIVSNGLPGKKTFNGDGRKVTKPLKTIGGNGALKKIILPSHRWKKNDHR